MTKKLLLPTRQTRMRIRREQMLECTPGKEADTVRLHNQDCENAENRGRLEQWIEEQQSPQQQPNAEQAGLQNLDGAEQALPRSSSPPPPALPPRPPSFPVPDEIPSSYSQRQALLQQIQQRRSDQAIEFHHNSQPYNSAEPIEPAISPNTKSSPTVKTSQADQFPSRSNTESTVTATARTLGQNAGILVTNALSREASASNLAHPLSNPLIRKEDQVANGDLSTRTHKPQSPPIPPKPKLNPFRLKQIQAQVQECNPEIKPEESPIRDLIDVPLTNTLYPQLPALQQEEHRPSMRTFTSSCGRFNVKAELLDWKMAKVELRKSNGLKIAVPLSRFSGADVEYVLKEMMRRTEDRAITTRSGDTQINEEEMHHNLSCQNGIGFELEQAYAVAT